MLPFGFEIFVLFLGLRVVAAASDAPLLQTNIGAFEGKLADYGEKGKVEIFYGLPYASKPARFEVGCLRDLIETGG
jgi:hypothetical protein